MSGFLKEVNIKSDMPSVSEAEDRLCAAVTAGRKLGAGAVKIIHGYGSTGKGGKIRTAVRRKAAEFSENVIFGEDFSIFNEATRQAFKACADLRKDDDLDRHNNGITIIIL
ncbi:MAG: Smr/MutS family protein [Oscillospiraceae bacterium]|nr:Smr/MutS family protein [Oscillospiraceae bacterium]